MAKFIKPVFFLLICIFVFISFKYYLRGTANLASQYRAYDQKQVMNQMHALALRRFYENRMGWSYSKLGEILFNREKIPDPNPNANKKFVVLVWKYWNWLKNRHVLNYGKQECYRKKTQNMEINMFGGNVGKPLGRDNEENILEGCSVTNCIFSGNDSLIDTADAVLIHLQRGVVPTVTNRNLKQRWIFLNDETPKHAFTLAKKRPSLDSLYNVFNWSMTYRSDADVPVPYGRTIPLEEPLISDYSNNLEEVAALVPNWHRKRRDKRVAVLMSNCGVKSRNDFIKKLRKYIHVDVYGRCADEKEFKKSCPGHFRADCDPIVEYLFYLVLENSMCTQYLTEKAFHNAYLKGAIPVIFGTSIDDVESLLPPHSYLYADENTEMKSLADDINALSDSTELLLGMHMWRNHFEIANEHGYFGTKSYHLCRLCEALNYNDEKEKIYDK